MPLGDSLRADGVRAADPTFQRAVDDRLTREVAERGLAVLALDANDPDGWLDVVEAACHDLVRGDQLDLL